MTKSEIRKQITAQRPDVQTLERLSEQIVKKFQTLELFRQAKAVGTYMPLPDEVDISPLFQTLEKQMYIPAYDEKSGGYRLAKYTPELKNGKFGIPEPENPVWAEADELDLILVPGVAFDRAGGRIGRGCGFYDRLLPQYDSIRAAICFDFQCLEAIPTESHDCTMDLLITESKILKFAMNS